MLKQSPSDAGLQGVVDIVGTWEELAVAVGVPANQIARFRHQPLPGANSLKYWRNGLTDCPTTWEFLLEEVSRIPSLGPRVAENIKKEMCDRPHWTCTEKPED